MFVVDGLPLVITWAIIIFFYRVFVSGFSFCNPFSCHNQFDFIKYSFAHVSDHGPCCLLGNDSVQAVMVKFRYPRDWATGCPEIWLNIILGASVRVFLDEINTGIGRLSKADGLSIVGGRHSIH